MEADKKKTLKVMLYLVIMLPFYYFGIFNKQYPNLVLGLGILSIISAYFAIIKGNLSKDLFLNIRKHKLRTLFFLAVNAFLLIAVMVTELNFDYKNLGLNVLFFAMKVVFIVEVILGFLINLSSELELEEREEV